MSMLAELTNQSNRRLPEGFEIQVLIINIPAGKSRSNTSLVEFLIFSPCLLLILRCSNPLPLLAPIVLNPTRKVVGE